MNLKFNKELAKGYSSNTQIARILTESWVKGNCYCPSCGNDNLENFSNNNPVGDFFCKSCKSEYELKSKRDSFALKIVDGAYEAMIQRINSSNNPNFFFLNYSFKRLEVQNFLVIPKHYFVDSIIQKRKPLSSNARRAGWIGCNIILQNIPSSGKIFLVRNGNIENKKTVLETWSKTAFIGKQKIDGRGWMIEVLNIVDKINENEFTLQQMYSFESLLKKKFPNNNFIKDKIRQQLQVLRDNGLLEFKGNGLYRKIGTLN